MSLYRRVNVSVYVEECLVQPCPARGAGSAHRCPGSIIRALVQHPAGRSWACSHLPLDQGLSMDLASPLRSEVWLVVVPTGVPPAQVLTLSVVDTAQATLAPG